MSETGRLNTGVKACRFLVGTSATLGTGFTLTKAFRIVLVEPDWLVSTELQVRKRVNRIGQRNLKTISYRLLAPDSVIEKGILRRQCTRSVFSKLILDFDGAAENTEAAKTLNSVIVDID